MKFRTLKITCFLVLLSSLAFQFRLMAQNLTMGSNSPSTGVTFKWNGDGSMAEEGSNATVTGTLTSADTAFAGPLFIWYPTKGAFMVGGSRSGMPISFLGLDSAAFGIAVAGGPYSIAGGGWSYASGQYSTALGQSTANGNYSTSLGQSTAFSNNSTALGAGMAFGNYSTALGEASAIGNYSTAAGDFVQSNSFDEAAVGAFNTNKSEYPADQQYFSATTWVSTDPIFDVGNGTSSSNPSDAFVVYKDGNAVLSGTLTVAPGGDIPMFTGGN